MRVNEVIITRIEGASDNTDERDQLNDALGQPAATGTSALAQIDADFLRRRRQRSQDDRYYGRTRRQTDAAADRR